MTGGVDALVARMGDVLDALVADGDPARFFLGTYLRITRAIGAALDRGLFEDTDWVAEWDVVFADLYLDALGRSRADPASAPEPWRLAFGASAELRPEAHVLLGVNAHVNLDQPQSLIRVVPPADMADPAVVALRHRDHERIDLVLAASVAAEDRALEQAGSRRTALDRVAAPVNRRAVAHLPDRGAAQGVGQHARVARGPAGRRRGLRRAGRRPGGGQRGAGGRPAAPRPGAAPPRRPRLRSHPAAGRRGVATRMIGP